ncbi:hypothetical protein XENOCAPTIV_003705 [Xenoophorus captivus]|uniref:Uncharacterized protein n=1 Tax=Xenoophorus captivus TaxID=1517983 RepID=A0ABV0QZS2_9TELE
MRTHKNTHTHAPNIKTNDNGRCTLTLTPPTYSTRCQYPIGTTSPRTQEVVPFPPGVETGRPPHHLNLVQTSPGSCLNLSDSGPDFDLIMENKVNDYSILISTFDHFSFRLFQFLSIGYLN